jgi:hypothetical protein
VKRRDWNKAMAAFEEAARLNPAAWTAEMLINELREDVPKNVWLMVQQTAARMRKRSSL